MAMAMLHGQTNNTMFAKQAVDTARETIIPNIYFYARGDNILLDESLPLDLRQRDLLYVNVHSKTSGVNTTGWFDVEYQAEEMALVEIMTTLFIIMVWLLGIVLFVGPVMILVSTKRILWRSTALFISLTAHFPLCDRLLSL
jgi:hypothetical protein